MGTEAVSPLQTAWLRVLGLQQFGASSDLTSHHCARELHTAARARKHSAQGELKKIGIFIPMELENYDPGEGKITHIYRWAD